MATAVTHADVAGLDFVLRREAADFGEGAVLVERSGQIERFSAADGFGDRRVDQRVETRRADSREHA